MIPKIIHTCTMGGWKLSPVGVHCVKSWLRVLPDYEIRIWNDGNAPESEWCRNAIAKKPVNASHWAQWRALYDHGGVFLDNDMEAIRPFDLSHEMFIGFQRADSEEFCINNAVVGMVPHHPFAKEMLERIEKEEPDSWPIITGVGILTEMMRERGLKGLNIEQKVGDIMVYDRERFYPWYHNEPPVPLDKLTDRTFAVHLWEGTWNKKA